MQPFSKEQGLVERGFFLLCMNFPVTSVFFLY